ncbi:MAG: hypothetical protein H0U23_01970 [Blastocatellia bacterium]|nr:hypothetical protein [Blastocatellia bacterium]
MRLALADRDRVAATPSSPAVSAALLPRGSSPSSGQRWGEGGRGDEGVAATPGDEGVAATSGDEGVAATYFLWSRWTPPLR